MDKDVVYTYTMEYYSATEKNKVMSFVATWLDLEVIISEGRERQIYHLCVGSKK